MLPDYLLGIPSNILLDRIVQDPEWMTEIQNSYKEWRVSQVRTRETPEGEKKPYETPGGVLRASDKDLCKRGQDAAYRRLESEIFRGGQVVPLRFEDVDY